MMIETVKKKYNSYHDTYYVFQGPFIKKTWIMKAYLYYIGWPHVPYKVIHIGGNKLNLFAFNLLVSEIAWKIRKINFVAHHTELLIRRLYSDKNKCKTRFQNRWNIFSCTKMCKFKFQEKKNLEETQKLDYFIQLVNVDHTLEQDSYYNFVAVSCNLSAFMHNSQLNKKSKKTLATFHLSDRIKCDNFECNNESSVRR